MSELPRHERRDTNTIVLGYEVLNLKSSSSSSQSSFKKSGYLTPPNSRASPIKPLSAYRNVKHPKPDSGTNTPTLIREARGQIAKEIVSKSMISAQEKYFHDPTRNRP